MAIALPPPIPPQQASPAALATQQQSALVVDYQGIHIHVSGSIKADVAELRKAIAAAASISDAVRAIGYLNYAAGYPATLVSYSLADADDLYVKVVLGRVKEVTGPNHLLPYFRDLKSSMPLTDDALEADRSLAESLVERRGEQYQLVLRPLGGDEVALDLGPSSGDGKRTSAVAGFSNYGNRYAGPYLFNAGLQQGFAGGSAFSLSGISSLDDVGNSGSDPYREADAGWSQLTPYGVLGIDGRYATFHQRVSDVPLDGKLSSAAVSWLYPLHADFNHRLNLQARLEHNEESVKAPDSQGNVLSDLLCALLGGNFCPAGGSSKILDESYESIELGLGYLTRVQLGEREANVQIALSARKGLGPSSSSGTDADLGYLLWRPSFSARYSATTHWTYIGEGRFQYTQDSVPQQEQFVIGGPASLHGHEAGAGVGDRGLNLRLAAEWKGDEDSWTERHQIRPRAFVEYGSAQLLATVLGAPPGKVALTDVGGEIEIQFTDWLYGTVSVAQSVHSEGEDNSPDGLAKQSVFFQLGAKY